MMVTEFRTRLPLTVPCIIFREPNRYDQHGTPSYVNGKHTKCAVLKLEKSIQDTTVRADSSGTRGHAMEVLADAWLLFGRYEKIAVDDRIDLWGHSIKITSVRPRFSVFGVHDHTEVKGMIEGDVNRDGQKNVTKSPIEHPDDEDAFDKVDLFGGL